MYSVEVEEKEKLPSGWIFEVTVLDGDESTNHEVELTSSDYEELTDNQVAPELLVEKCFEFLLARQEKENLLPEFNVTEIKLYFPEFDEVISEMLVEM
ncbi:MAG: hypothetical protein Q8Q32_00975 [bacterium]|nr:hypothetical protein [bacterium]